MKKYLLTIITVGLTLPVFAANFEENFLINADFKKEIAAPIISSLEQAIMLNNGNTKQESGHKIVKMIREEMEQTLKQIKRNTKLRKNIFTHNFVEEQKIQKQKYENMLNENVPYQIFNYIAGKFNLNKIENTNVICRYTNDTLIEVRFDYLNEFVVVYYDYDYKNKQGQISPITHQEN